MQFKILIPLDDHEGAETGRLWTCSRGAKVEAPAGEFAGLGEDDYKRLGDQEGAHGPEQEEATGNNLTDDSPTTTTEEDTI